MKDAAVAFLHGQFQQDLAVFQICFQGLEGVDLVGQNGALPENGFGVFRIVPESFPGENMFDLREPFFLVSQVKDNPEAVLIADEDLSWSVSVL